MNIEGQYQGPRTYFNADTVLQHLNGEIYPLAFNVVTRAKASYLCIDLDKRFHTRLPIAIAELEVVPFCWTPDQQT
jgi:hypothetical protein